MTFQEVMDELETMGTEQNRKTYARHGVKSPMFGVSCANLEKLRKKIKANHDLAQELWATGNHDARYLATLIADPTKADDALLNRWADDLNDHVLTGAFATFAGRSPLARQKAEEWMNSENECLGSTGWHVLAMLAGMDNNLPDDYYEKHLAIIERDIHSRKNRIRHSMNNVLIAIGTRSDELEKKAIAAARRIGRVEVDHGDTSCKTPDAVTYIPKAREYQRKRAAQKGGE